MQNLIMYYFFFVDSIVQWDLIGLGWILGACFHLFLRSKDTSFVLCYLFIFSHVFPLQKLILVMLQGSS
jgi:hypothetical protein